MRTAKSCGPDAPTLALRSRSDPRTTGAKEPGPRGEHEISRKTIAQGRPDDCGVPVVANACAFFCTRGRGCNARPVFPAPSDFLMAQSFHKTRTLRAARTRSRVLSSPSPRPSRGEVTLNASRVLFEIFSMIRIRRAAINPVRRHGRRPATPVGPCGPPTPCCGLRSAWRPVSP
jgi:hypothetical protein